MATSISTEPNMVNRKNLMGRIDPPSRVAPDADKQVHGDQHHFPEDIEQEEVQGTEHPDHTAHQGQQANHEFLDPGLDVRPGGQDTQRGQEVVSMMSSRGTSTPT